MFSALVLRPNLRPNGCALVCACLYLPARPPSSIFARSIAVLSFVGGVCSRRFQDLAPFVELHARLHPGLQNEVDSLSFEDKLQLSLPGGQCAVPVCRRSTLLVLHRLLHVLLADCLLSLALLTNGVCCCERTEHGSLRDLMNSLVKRCAPARRSFSFQAALLCWLPQPKP